MDIALLDIAAQPRPVRGHADRVGPARHGGWPSPRPTWQGCALHHVVDLRAGFSLAAAMARWHSAPVSRSGMAQPSSHSRGSASPAGPSRRALARTNRPFTRRPPGAAARAKPGGRTPRISGAQQTLSIAQTTSKLPSRKRRAGVVGRAQAHSIAGPRSAAARARCTCRPESVTPHGRWPPRCAASHMSLPPTPQSSVEHPLAGLRARSARPAPGSAAPGHQRGRAAAMSCKP